MISGGDWKKSAHIKCMAIFILQLVLIYVVAKLLDVSSVLVDLFLVGFFGILFLCVNAATLDFAPHKLCIGFAVYLLALHMLMNFDGFFTSAHRERHELKLFSGIIFEPSRGGGKGGALGEHINLKSPEGNRRNWGDGEPYSGFYCDRFLGKTCNEELKKYFGDSYTSWQGKTITVKYAEFRHYGEILPFITNKGGLIYEMSHDDKVIYPYEYFIDKYSTGKKNFYIFTIFLLGATIGFGVIYKTSSEF